MKREHPSLTTASAAAAILLVGALLAGCGRPEQTAGATPVTGSLTAEPESGAQGAAGAAPESPLAGTDWRLVEFQSMDDAIGTTRPGEPSLFTMRLDADGTVHMQLDCNRATGTWSAEPGADGDSGRFEFGPLAATRALCPPPNLDERIVADAEYVRGYLLRDGRLYLSLMADGGIYAWEPNTEAGGRFETEPDAEVEEAILRASPDYTREIVEIEGRIARYVYGRFDLNGDGRKELFVYLLGSTFCGSGGCNLLLFADGEGGYTLLNNFPISRLPVIISSQTTAGWNDLIRPESGGGAPPSYVVHTFDGERYVEQDRLPADPEPEGARFLDGELTFDDGIPLEPGS